DEVGLPARDLWPLLGRRDLRREVVAALRQGHRAGIARLDTGRLRMRFPCRLRIELRSGRTLEVDGEEAGASGRPLEEQRAVVAGVSIRVLITPPCTTSAIVVSDSS